ncbi:hypothetical protein SAMN04488483_1488 [Pseudomonas helmanticensis]|uniref:Uncharacterized protein n=1 Tax=Pseudomonas helmanticensis TaxID=1471381 RepID=A0ACD2U301_9PSED|nr:hypothetical protein SAMN04488483_1488 [Pseudomonas helmanticensis]
MDVDATQKNYRVQGSMAKTINFFIFTLQNSHQQSVKENNGSFPHG